jgi:hypothetical protein
MIASDNFCSHAANRVSASARNKTRVITRIARSSSSLSLRQVVVSRLVWAITTANAQTTQTAQAQATATANAQATQTAQA